VVNNAGVVAVQTVEESSVDDWDRVMATNVRSIFLTTKHALGHFRAAGGGSILNVASVSSFVGQQGRGADVDQRPGAGLWSRAYSRELYLPRHHRHVAGGRRRVHRVRRVLFGGVDTP
jgi:NAD(P)-dependent dehydrogenase (short-subunit alcohol dehydrogenase family)